MFIKFYNSRYRTPPVGISSHFVWNYILHILVNIKTLIHQFVEVKLLAHTMNDQ